MHKLVGSLLLMCCFALVAAIPAAIPEDDFSYDGRIVGGSPTAITNFPHQVSFQWNNAHICGGSVLTPNIIVTAAHCIASPDTPGSYSVRAGSTQHNIGGDLVPVKRIITHEGYSTGTLNNDIALIQLTRNLTYSRSIAPVQLAEQDEELPAWSRLYVSGWGLTSETGSISPILRFVGVQPISQETCTENYKYIATVTPQMFCAGYPNGGKDSCQGDSGGPLVGLTLGRPKLYGVVSWGVGCAQRGYPGVYARIAALRPWIDRTLTTIV